MATKRTQHYGNREAISNISPSKRMFYSIAEGGFLNVQWGYYLDKFVYWSKKNSHCALVLPRFLLSWFLYRGAGRDNDQHFSRLWAIIQGKLLNSPIHFILHLISNSSEKCTIQWPRFRVWHPTQLLSDYTLSIYTISIRLLRGMWDWWSGGEFRGNPELISKHRSSFSRVYSSKAEHSIHFVCELASACSKIYVFNSACGVYQSIMAQKKRSERELLSNFCIDIKSF
jgi:hypothetical protein